MEQSADSGVLPETGRIGESVPATRIALLTPYNGGNFGDAAIQDAMIANLRLRLPNVRISGITLNSASFLERHGAEGFPLCASKLRFYGMSGADETPQPRSESSHTAESPTRQGTDWTGAARNYVRKVPGVRRLARKLKSYASGIGDELRHWRDARRFLREQDLLIVSGGGQLDEEWGGPWGHPFSLFKWALLARLAGVPLASASVGTGKSASWLSRAFFAAALRLARYRSFRDVNSQRIASKWLGRAAKDEVIPDLAFSLPAADFAPFEELRSLANGRPIVALSPIAYAKPGSWPTEDRALYQRYRNEMAQVVSRLVESGYFVTVVWSSLGDDEKVFPEIMDALDEGSRKRFSQSVFVPSISNWKELSALLASADFLIASRMHSTILGFLAGTPTVAISFDPKVDWVMQDLGQQDYLLKIGDFTAAEVLRKVETLAQKRDSVVEEIGSYRERVGSLFARQYDTLAKLALVKSRK